MIRSVAFLAPAQSVENDNYHIYHHHKALKVLKKNGVEVQEAYPGCCGMPFLEQADLPKVVEQAKKVSKDLLEWVDKGYKVITLTASCGLMLKFEWPLLLPKDENIKRLSLLLIILSNYLYKYKTILVY
mgnify:CR=1 FL=1